jgi:hypothetical protein
MKGSPVRVRASALEESPAYAGLCRFRASAPGRLRERGWNDLATWDADLDVRRPRLGVSQFRDHVPARVERDRRCVPEPLRDLDNGLALPIAAGVLELVGFVLRPEVGAISMSGSSVIVALNAVSLKRLRLPARPKPLP